MKFLILSAIFLGEFVGIWLEIFSANKFKDAAPFSAVAKYLLILMPLFIICLSLLLLGYIYGYRHFEKIWVITIVSWASIIIVETVLNFIIFHEFPKGNTLVAGILAIAAIVISLVPAR